MRSYTGVPSPISWVRYGWGMGGLKFGRGGGLAFDLANVQALLAGFD